MAKQGSPEFVPEAERIATFDTFALDRVKALAPQHPEWKEKEPFVSLTACAHILNPMKVASIGSFVV